MEENNFFEEFIKNFNKEMKEMGHANLIIAGKTGVGKSTLINAAFREDVAKTGIGTPVTDEGDVRWYEKKGFPLRIYDTIGLELNEEKRRRSIEMIKKVCQDGKKSNDPDKLIHVMWYCVASDCDRLEKYEVDYINSISEEVEVVLVITKSYRKKHSERLVKAIEKDYPGLKVKNKVVVLAQDENPDDCDEDVEPKKAFGVDTLVEITAQIVPESAQKAWCNAQKASLELKCNKAQTLVCTTAAASFGEGYIPLPFSDALALVPTQLAMLAGITAIFGITVSENLLKSIVASLAGTASTTFAGRTIVSNLLKMIPGVGTALGGTISGVTATVLTTALGEAYIAIMKMIANAEISEKDLETKAVQQRLQNIFKEKLKIETN
ncbi:MAG: YcjF family protein [Lachnospiraceae bacterium]